MDIKRITYDYETQSPVNLKRAGAWEYSLHPETKPMCLAFKISGNPTVQLLDYYWINKPWEELPQKFRDLWRGFIEKRYLFCAHNHFFETTITDNIMVKRYGWPEIPLELRRCTAAKAAAVAIPRNLLDAGAVMRTTTQKDYEGHRVMLKLCKPTAEWAKWAKAKENIGAGKRVRVRTRWVAEKPEPVKYWTPKTMPHDFSTLYQYCKVDAFSEEDLDKALPDLSPFEQKLWWIDQKINLRGVSVDMDLVNRIAFTMKLEAHAMNTKLDILTMGLVSSGNARDAILDFMALEGIIMPDLKAKTVDEFLANGKVTGDAEKVLKIRRALAKSSTAKYATFLIRAATDGRVRDLLLYHGASTGRWGGKGIQPQNFPRGIIKDIFEAIERIKTCTTGDLKLLYGENLMPLFSSVLRGMFIATPGKNLYVEDYSAIECRITWWLAGHEKGLQMFRDGIDPYKIMAVDIYRKSILEITDNERQVGKAAVLGCGFQMGAKKFISSAWDVYRARVTKEIAKVAVTAYREKHWPVTELWENYQNAAIWAVQNPTKKYRVGKIRFYMEDRFLKIELPSGRKLSYCDPKVTAEPVYQYEYKGETLYTGSKILLLKAVEEGAKRSGQFSAEKLSYMAINMKAKKEDCVIPKWTRESTYGGKLTENIVQAVARDILAEAIVRAEEAGFEVLMHSHDELVSEVSNDTFFSGTDAPETHYKKIMETLPPWAEGLPLTSGGWNGPRYKKG